MVSRRRGVARGHSRSDSGLLRAAASATVRWIAVPCMGIVLFASLVASAVSLYSASSSTHAERFASMSLPGHTLSFAAPRRAPVQAAQAVKPAPVEEAALPEVASVPVDPFAKVIADAGLSREKLLAAFADAGLAVALPEVASEAEAAPAMPVAERFHHVQESADPQYAQNMPDEDPLSSFALTHAGLKVAVAYAPPDGSPGDTVSLAMATLALETFEDDVAVASAETAQEEAEQPAARMTTRAERRNARQRAEPQAVARATSTQSTSVPARRPGMSHRLESSQPVLAYARPDRPDNGAFNKLFNTPKAGNRVAIYDISAAVVYMPDGTKLEAHSGIGKMADNPRYVHVKNNGPTPPNTYKLSMRESRFYGVEAIRMTPIGDQTMHGRNGILAHSYLLRGGRAESHGCVAFKDYDRFLKAFKQGKVTHMVVVPRFSDAAKVQLVSAGRD